jgi:hypothetical protein
MTASAIGERQMLPVHTKQIRYVIAAIVAPIVMVQPVDQQLSRS